MAAKKKTLGFTKLLINLMLVVPSIYRIASNLITTIEYEAILAKKSLISICILLLFSITLLFGAWFCICGVAFFWLLSLQFNYISIFLILLAAHFLLLIFTTKLMSKSKHNLTFPLTRDLFH